MKYIYETYMIRLTVLSSIINSATPEASKDGAGPAAGAATPAANGVVLCKFMGACLAESMVFHHSPTLVWGLIARIHEVQGVPRRTVIIRVFAFPGQTAGIFG